MNKKGLVFIKTLCYSSFRENILYVVSAEDNAVKNDYKNEIVDICNKFKIKIYHRKDTIIESTDYIFAIGWRWIINYSRSTLITLHDSILPQYRGFSPLVSQLIDGVTEIGVTAILANEEYDKGDILHSISLPIQYPITIAEAIDIISEAYGQLGIEVVNSLISNTIKPVRQDESKATYSLWRDEKDYRINWNWSSIKIIRFIDAVGYPYLGASSYLNEELVKITKAEAIPDVLISNRSVGKVINIKDGLPIVVCGEGLIKVVEAKLINKTLNLLPFKKFRSRFE